MTVELITGFAGTPHIGSDDVGAFNAGLVGPGDYALTTGNQLKATMSNAKMKTVPTTADVLEFLARLDDSQQRQDSETLIEVMQKVSGKPPVMWGPAIIGFDSYHYKYETGREGDMPLLGFSPRKARLTIYFSEGFDRYGDQLARLGKHSSSVSCLYATKLADLDLDVLREMLETSHRLYAGRDDNPTQVAE